MGSFNNVVFSRNHYMPHYLTPYIIERVTVLLKDRETTATIYPLFETEGLPENLLLFLTQEYNDEIARGDTQPFFDPLTPDEFKDYWFGQFAAVMVIGDEPKLNRNTSVREWANKCLGAMFIKSNYPGRSAHVCTANLLVNAGIRRKGIGTMLAECMVRWAPRLGYSYGTVELVFDTNTPAKQVLERLNFKKIGRVKGAGLLKSTKDTLIDSLTYGRELQLEPSDDSTASKHEQIKNYLTSGQYPESATRQEKSRLRSLAYHYNMRDGRLFLKDKEVISAVHDQFQIIRRVHLQGGAHLGINRTTAIICEKYHWPKIKETVINVIRQCPECKDPARSSVVRTAWMSNRVSKAKKKASSLSAVGAGALTSIASKSVLPLASRPLVGNGLGSMPSPSAVVASVPSPSTAFAANQSQSDLVAGFPDIYGDENPSDYDQRYLEDLVNKNGADTGDRGVSDDKPMVGNDHSEHLSQEHQQHEQQHLQHQQHQQSQQDQQSQQISRHLQQQQQQQSQQPFVVPGFEYPSHQVNPPN